MNNEKLILLSGNPNVGKSSIFNLLTGMHQHTGNWTGKTVSTQIGRYKKDKNIKLVDLPGTYSLLCISLEEVVARDAILFDNPYKNIIVVDSCSLERNLNLVLQILEVSKNVILCLNLKDEMDSKGISIDINKLESMLGVSVVLCSARNKEGIKKLTSLMYEEKENKGINIKYDFGLEKRINELELLIEENISIDKRFVALKLLEGDKTIVNSIKERFGKDILSEKVNNYLRDVDSMKIRKVISLKINEICIDIANNCVSNEKDNINSTTRKIDNILTNKLWGSIISIMLLFLVFYITIVLSNIPSAMLSNLFNFLIDKTLDFCISYDISQYIYGPIVSGLFRTLGWVVSVMLPPMLIFFALFGLAEECGLLPRIAFNADKIFKKCKAHGKQVLTMCIVVT
ncbi:MAG: FeoB small GTPase domain-containing protein [Bacilli bacterium]